MTGAPPPFGVCARVRFHALKRVIKSDVLQILIGESVERLLHVLVFLVDRTVAALKGLHCLHEIFGMKTDKAWHALLVADAVLAVALRARLRCRLAGCDRIDVFRRRLIGRQRGIETRVIGGQIGERRVAKELQQVHVRFAAASAVAALIGL